MKITDQKGWDKGLKNNADSYGKAVYRYAEKWADRMEAEIESGKKLEDIAEKTSHNIGEDITGFQYGCVIGVLAKAWEHGDALRVWHNKQYGVKEEEGKTGVVNPAILILKTK